MQLTREIIVDAAIDILDAYGLQDLSIRRLARQLDAAAGAMYWHVPSKQALLGLVADRILAAAPTPTPAADWAETTRAYVDTLHAALSAHRDGAEVVSAALSTRMLTANPAGTLATLLAPSTLPATDCQLAADALVFLLLGATIDEQTTARLADAESPATPQNNPTPRGSIDFGVTLILAGITSRTTPPQPGS